MLGFLDNKFLQEQKYPKFHMSQNGYFDIVTYIINNEKIDFQIESILTNNEEWLRYTCKCGSFDVHPMMDKSVVEKAYINLLEKIK